MSQLSQSTLDLLKTLEGKLITAQTGGVRVVGLVEKVTDDLLILRERSRYLTQQDQSKVKHLLLDRLEMFIVHESAQPGNHDTNENFDAASRGDFQEDDS